MSLIYLLIGDEAEKLKGKYKMKYVIICSKTGCRTESNFQSLIGSMKSIQHQVVIALAYIFIASLC